MMFRYSLVFLTAAMVALGLSQVEGASRVRKTTPYTKKNEVHNLEALGDTVQELYYEKMPIDHFTNHGQPATYRMRYLLDDSNVDKEAKNPPILFYCGNEGAVTTFYKNSGFMTKTLATELKGLVLLGEHRYYGKSKPFGD